MRRELLQNWPSPIVTRVDKCDDDRNPGSKMILVESRECAFKVRIFDLFDVFLLCTLYHYEQVIIMIVSELHSSRQILILVWMHFHRGFWLSTYMIVRIPRLKKISLYRILNPYVLGSMSTSLIGTQYADYCRNTQYSGSTCGKSNRNTSNSIGAIVVL